MGTLKPQSNGPLYSNTVIGTLAVDGWAVTFGTARMGLGVTGTGSGTRKIWYQIACMSDASETGNGFLPPVLGADFW